MLTLRIKLLREKQSYITREGPEPRTLGCFFLAFSPDKEIELSWAEDVDLNMSINSCNIRAIRIASKTENEMNNKKEQRSRGQEIENWKGRRKEHMEMKGLKKKFIL